MRFGFFGPIVEYLLAQLANLLDSAGFGFVSRTSFDSALIDHLGDLEQALAQMRTAGKAFIKTRLIFGLI